MTHSSMSLLDFGNSHMIDIRKYCISGNFGIMQILAFVYE